MPTGGSWFDLLTAAVSGGVVVKVLDVVYAEIRRHFDGAKNAKEFVSTHLDPVLKSADEVVGKIRAYAERDFQDLVSLQSRDYQERLDSLELAGFAYLIACFWSRVELFRKQGLTFAIGKDKRGRRLSSFLTAMESRGGRLVDRTTQRAIGEALIEGGDAISFIEFVKRYELDPSFRRWVWPLVAQLCDCKSKARRQQLLKFGVVMHAMVDTLDQAHHVSKERPGYANKLASQTRQDLKYRVFRLHLSFVKASTKYYGPDKKIGGPPGPTSLDSPLGPPLDGSALRGRKDRSAVSEPS